MTSAPGLFASRSPDPSIPPADGSCPFETLPNELRDIVFDYAYVKNAPFRPCTRWNWNLQKERRHFREKRKFVPGTFGPYHVERFMISRSWLAGALKYFYERTPFSFEDWADVISFFDSSASAYILESSTANPEEFRLERVPAQTYLASISAVAFSNHRLPICFAYCKPGLKNVRLQLGSDFFGESLEKDVEEEEWTLEDFQSYEPTKGLFEAEDLPNLVIEPHFHYWHTNEERIDMLKRNVEHFEKLLREELACPRPAREPESEPEPSPAPEVIGISTPYQGSPKYSPTSPSYVAAKFSAPVGSPMYSAISPSYNGPEWNPLIESPKYMYSATSPPYHPAPPRSPSLVREMYAGNAAEKEKELISPLSPGVDPNQDLHIPISHRADPPPRCMKRKARSSLVRGISSSRSPSS